ncbi:glycosyltransferase [Sphingomonas psychrotolerans]|uniref:Glycosyltransferase n=1 Tax=Sphingomonas psychrotolerans TaxID=1327635 RepID=A0ABU3N6P3_9SPHN|nr:glycosyltransferase [Sphingomonas psychrotolerans]MDT8760058.1 glycosyltransferase [Sphingomonas psychrotolerans]
MRIFQNFDVYPQYLEQRRQGMSLSTYASVREHLMVDRFIAVHMLQPVLEEAEEAAFAVGRDAISQRDWARSQGMSERSSLHEILLAQIEHHRTEVFYNLDAMRFRSDFARTLPGCVKRSIAWRAGPSGKADFGAYDLIVCNFESILQSFRERGWRAAWFYPAFDPVMSDYAVTSDRTWDVVFVGSYSRYHTRRASILTMVAGLGAHYKVKVCLQRSMLTQLAEIFPRWVPLLGPHRVRRDIAEVAEDAVYGRDLYRLFSRAKIVVNGAIDMAGPDRGNIRCWEALGCRALMLSDRGIYPRGFESGNTIQTYDSVDDLTEKVAWLLTDTASRERIADAGYAMIHSQYSKAQQWHDFQQLAA